MRKEIQKELCKICNEKHKYIGRHLKNIHGITLKHYFDNHIKTPDMGICIVCGNNAPFKWINKNTGASGYGYSKYCCLKCQLTENAKHRRGIPHTKETKKIISEKRTAWFKTDSGKEWCKQILSEGRKGLKNPCYKIKDKISARHKQSISMKRAISEGRFTPCITNSWANSKCKVYLNAKNQWCRSTWEAVFWILNPDLQYENVRIQYTINGEYKIYIVDFVDHIKKMLYEIKPKNHFNIEKTAIKQAAAIEWCKVHGYTYTIIDDEYFKQNAKRVDYSKYDSKIFNGMKQFLT